MKIVANLLLVLLSVSLSGCGGFDLGLNPFDDSSQSSRIRNVPSSVIVDSDDTVHSIARRYNLVADDIISLNGLKHPYRLTKGGRLRLPRPRHHTVASGDTLSRIASGYGVDMNTLAQLNGLEPPYPLNVGQQLRLPGAGGAAGDRHQVASVSTSEKATHPTLPEPEKVSGYGFMWPAKGKILSRFGRKSDGLHNDGINVALSNGSRVKATENGTVAYAGNEIRGFGNLLLIKHGGGWVSAYAHNQSLLVRKGQKVKRGQVIAKAGSTGNVSSPQLHFELRKNGKSVDPLRYLPR